MSLIISLEQRRGSVDMSHVRNLSQSVSKKSEVLRHDHPTISQLPGEKAPVVILNAEAYLYGPALNTFIANLIEYLSRTKVWGEVVDVDVVTPAQTIRVKNGNWQS